jgi:hypothetical protein
VVLPGAGGDDFTPGGWLEAYATCDFVLVSGRHRLLSSGAVQCCAVLGWVTVERWGGVSE